MQTISISIINYPGAMASAVAGVSDLFTLANRFSAEQRYNVMSIAPEDKLIGHPTRIVYVPPTLIEAPPDPAAFGMPDVLHRHHSDGAIVIANCASVIWLAESGLLNGKVATTHWKLFEYVTERYPDIDVIDRRSMVVDQGRVVTAAGLYAFQDLVLYMIAKFSSFGVAKSVADFALLDIQNRVQSYYQRFIPNFSHADNTVLTAQKLCEQLRPSELSVSVLAAKAHTTERTLNRRFKETLGMTPGFYIQQVQIEASKRALDLKLSSIEQVAAEVGYQDVSNFNRAFKRICGITPSKYRDRVSTHLADKA